MEKMKKPAWLKLTEEDLKKIIKELAEQGKQPAQIGLILRDKYAVPSTKLYGKKLKQYLKELGLETDAELKNAEKKFKNLSEHMKKNITDKNSKHRLQKAQSRLNIVKRYFARKKN